MKKDDCLLPTDRGYGVSNLGPEPQFANGAATPQQEASLNPNKKAAKRSQQPGPWDPEVQGIHTVGAGRR